MRADEGSSRLATSAPIAHSRSAEVQPCIWHSQRLRYGDHRLCRCTASCSGASPLSGLDSRNRSRHARLPIGRAPQRGAIPPGHERHAIEGSLEAGQPERTTQDRRLCRRQGTVTRIGLYRDQEGSDLPRLASVQLLARSSGQERRRAGYSRPLRSGEWTTRNRLLRPPSHARPTERIRRRTQIQCTAR